MPVRRKLTGEGGGKKKEEKEGGEKIKTETV